jgi:hypothetical protein
VRDDRFTRWQRRTIEQLGFSINLVLTLAWGTLGYTVATYDKTSSACMLKFAFVLASVLLLCAVFFGIAASLTRLYDFRLTARKIREEEEVEKSRLGAITERLGSCTWFLFWAETVAFALGVCAVVALVLRGKL